MVVCVSLFPSFEEMMHSYACDSITRIPTLPGSLAVLCNVRDCCQSPSWNYLDNNPLHSTLVGMHIGNCGQLVS